MCKIKTVAIILVGLSFFGSAHGMFTFFSKKRKKKSPQAYKAPTFADTPADRLGDQEKKSEVIQINNKKIIHKICEWPNLYVRNRLEEPIDKDEPQELEWLVGSLPDKKYFLRQKKKIDTKRQNVIDNISAKENKIREEIASRFASDQKMLKKIKMKAKQYNQLTIKTKKTSKKPRQESPLEQVKAKKKEKHQRTIYYKYNSLIAIVKSEKMRKGKDKNQPYDTIPKKDLETIRKKQKERKEKNKKFIPIIFGKKTTYDYRKDKCPLDDLFDETIQKRRNAVTKKLSAY